MNFGETRRSARLRQQSNNENLNDAIDSSSDGMDTEELNHIMQQIEASPESKSKIADFSSQTTPGLAKNGPKEKVVPIANNGDEDSDEEQQCPICFEAWTNSGSHRISSLLCGHLFGKSCIERWLKDTKNRCCPQCKAKAARKDIRNIYTKSLKAYDTTERDQAKKELLEEKYKRARSEENEARAILQTHILKAEMEKLRKQIADQQKPRTSCSSSHSDRQPLASTRQSTFISSQSSQSSQCSSQSSFQSSPATYSSQSTRLEAISKSYTFQKTLQVSQKEARVMAYDKNNMLMVVSKPSPNQLFPGYGILKVSSLGSRSSEYIRIHQRTIRDAKFNGSGDQLILTASTDKTLKLTSVLSNSTVQSYVCPSPVWACAWNETDRNYVYAGLQNGACLVFDIRKTEEQLATIRPRVGVPIVSLSYISAGDENSLLRCEGILVGTIQGGWFIQKTLNDAYKDHRLLFPEGSCSGLYFEPRTRHCLLSQRPGKKSARATHSICQLIGDSSDTNPLQAIVIRQCFGGNRAQSLTRSSLFTCPDDSSRLLLSTGDEASSSVIVWDGSRGSELQKLPSSGGTVFDVMAFEAYDSNFLATLTEQKLSFYQWQ